MKDRWQDIPSAEEWGRPGLNSGGRDIAYAAIEGLLCDFSTSKAGELSPPDENWCARVVDDYAISLGYLAWPTRLGIRFLIRLVEWLPLVVSGRASRMSRLKLPERVAYLEGLENHRWALLTMLLIATKVPMTLSAYEQGEPLRMTGFDRPDTVSRRKLDLAEHYKEHS
jgi:hypothetical protein